MENIVIINDCVDGRFVVEDKSIDALTINLNNVIGLKTLVWGKLVIENPTELHLWTDGILDTRKQTFTVDAASLNPALNPELNKFRVYHDSLTVLRFPKL